VSPSLGREKAEVEEMEVDHDPGGAQASRREKRV